MVCETRAHAILLLVMYRSLSMLYFLAPHSVSMHMRQKDLYFFFLLLRHAPSTVLFGRTPQRFWGREGREHGVHGKGMPSWYRSSSKEWFVRSSK
jgi:hypothetical protein